MQNSIAWIVSAVLSVAAHYGLMAVAAQIPLPQSGEQPLAEVLLGNASFQAVTLVAAAGAQGAEIQTADTLTETSTAVDQEMTPADAVEAGPQQTEEIAQSASAPDTSSASAAAELAPDGTAETASQPGNDAEAKAATPAIDVAAESPTELTQDTATAPSTEAPQAVAPLAPAREASTTALPEQDSAAIATTPAPSAETSSAAAPVVEAPPAKEALPEGSAATVEAPVAEVSSVGSTPELVPSKPAESAPALAAGTKMAAAVTAPAPVLSQGDRVRSFMRNYQGNGCIYAQANDTDAARPSFKGLGGESGAVSDFAAAFKQAVGIEPELALRAVMDPQCPAVDFISTIAGGERQNLEVVLDQEVV